MTAQRGTASSQGEEASGGTARRLPTLVGLALTARRLPTLGGLALVLALAGCVEDGGPHPETPLLQPPDRASDGGVSAENPDDAHGGAGGTAGAAGGGGGGAPPACADAGIDTGWDDEDAGTLR